MPTDDIEHHETIGWMYQNHAGTFRCTRWLRDAGFDMCVVTATADAHVDRQPGAVFNVSERAIGRTFHRVRNDDSYEPHAAGCNCWMCEGRPRR